MVDPFVGLHVHTEHSPLDALPSVKELVQRVVELEQAAVAITDHGNCGGHVRLAHEATKQGIHPIFGMEGYFCDDRFERGGGKGVNGSDHIVLLAKTQTGLENLWTLSSLSYTEGFYYNPRIDWELLERYGDGLFVSGGCQGGCIGKHVHDQDKIVERVGRFQELLGSRFYLELHTLLSDETKEWNNKILEIANTYGIPYAVVSDSHYLRPDDWYQHELTFAISTDKKMDDETRYQYGYNQLATYSSNEIRDRLAYLPPEAVERGLAYTKEIADQCEAAIEDKISKPVFFDSPKEDSERLRRLAEAGFQTKVIPYIHESKVQEYRDRFEYEFGIIEAKGYCGYFLIVQDLVNWAKGDGILIAVGRGSAAGSLLSYLLNITEIDPIKHGLFFERFLDIGRETLPDIDIDFPDCKKKRVRQYLESKYGNMHIAIIGTVNTSGIKQSIRDLAKALGASSTEIAAIIKIVDENLSHLDEGKVGDGSETVTASMWDSFYQANKAKFAQWQYKYPQLFEAIPKTVGHLRHSSAHAGGVVISKKSLLGQLPLSAVEDREEIRTQLTMKDVEALGFLKLDVLWIRTLSTLMKATELIEARGKKIEHFYNWQYDYSTYYGDQDVWDDICAGHNIGCFQIETNGLRQLTKRAKPRSLEELSAVIALFRPGVTRATDKETGLSLLELYLQKLEGKRPVTYKHPLLKSILGNTYGMFVYQEQGMKTANVLAGYELHESDRLRRMMGKKLFEQMKEERPNFVRRCWETNQIDEATANAIFDEMEYQGIYSFNLPHSLAYAHTAFWCAYIKHYFPEEFMAALFQTNPEDVLVYTRESRRLGIPVLGPDINQSESGFTLTDEGIRYGLSSIKFLGNAASIIQDMRPFASVSDIVSRIPKRRFNTKQAQYLIRSGAADSLMDLQYVPNLSEKEAKTLRTELAMYEYLKVRGDKKMNPDVRHDETCPDCRGAYTFFECKNNSEWRLKDRAFNELTTLGTTVTVDALDKYLKLIQDEERFPGQAFMLEGEACRIGGLIINVKPLKVKKKGKYFGQAMCQITIQRPLTLSKGDHTEVEREDTLQIVCFPKTYSAYSQFIEFGAPVIVDCAKLRDGLSLTKLYRLDMLLKQRESQSLR